MSNNTLRIGLFTATNIAAVLAAIKESNGTYADISHKAREYGGDVSPNTIAKWITRGRRDLSQNKNTALARFTKHYNDRVAEHCGPEVNRARQLDIALFKLERRCECGQEKMLAPDGSLADHCRSCAEIDATPRRMRSAT